MANIKMMFRSPRFIVGFILVFAILFYAIFVPIIFPGNPKESRAQNPFYERTIEFTNVLLTEDDAAIAEGIAALRADAAAVTDPILADAASNLVETMDLVEATLASTPAADAISALDQVKSARKFPLVKDEREAMRAFLEAEDYESARAEGERLNAHFAEANVFVESLTAAGSDFAAAQAALDAFATKTDAEVADIVSAISAQDEGALTAAIADYSDQHAALEKYVGEAIARLDTNYYIAAAEAAGSKIQKTYLIPKDSPPSSQFWFGTDSFSRDLFLELAYGARTSLLVGLIAGVLATAIGLTLGLTAGYVGGWIDNIITVVTNTFIVIPGFVILVLISIAIGQFREAWVTGVIVGCIAWPWTARAVRAQTTSLRYRDHVNMARITGYSTAHIIFTEIVPYIMSYVVMAFILQIAGGIMQESTLALLGLGDPTGISLGRLMNWAMEYEAINYNRWWEFIPVACAIAMITFGLYLMNSGMDQVFNPKIRS